MDEVFQKDKFSFKPGEHKGKDVIWIHFVYDSRVKNHLREHTKAKWSNTQKAWFVPDVPVYRKLFGLEPPKPKVSKEVMSKIHTVNQTEMERYINLMILKGYSPNTIRTYSLEFAQLLYILKEHPAFDLTPDRLQSYFLYCAKKLNLSENQIYPVGLKAS